MTQNTPQTEQMTELQHKAQAIAYSDNSPEEKEQFILDLVAQALSEERTRIKKWIGESLLLKIDKRYVLEALKEEA